MTELWFLCCHLSSEPHWWPAPIGDDDQCPGGHVATVEEVVEWLRGSVDGEQALHEATCEYCQAGKP